MSASAIVDQAAFDRAALLLVVDIPDHINECPACRKGDVQLQAALRSDDHAAAATASHVFCAAGNALIQEFSERAAKALGYPWPPRSQQDSCQDHCPYGMACDCQELHGDDARKRTRR